MVKALQIKMRPKKIVATHGCPDAKMMFRSSNESSVASGC